MHALPVYLRPVTLLEAKGDVAAEVVAAVHELSRRGWRRAKRVVVALAVIASAVAIGYYTFQMREYDCRSVATNARAFANQMIVYANTAGQRETAIVEDLSSLLSDKTRADVDLLYEGLDPSQQSYREQQLTFRYYQKRFALEDRLSSVVKENNSLMSKLAKESNQHRSAIFAHCLDGGDASSPESDLSFDTGEAISRPYSLGKRFKDFVKLAKQLEELAARAAGAGGEPSKKARHDEEPAN